jgi:hypothetical protein
MPNPDALFGATVVLSLFEATVLGVLCCHKSLYDITYSGFQF